MPHIRDSKEKMTSSETIYLIHSKESK